MHRKLAAAGETDKAGAEHNADAAGMGTDGAGNCGGLSKVGWDDVDAAIGLVAGGSWKAEGPRDAGALSMLFEAGALDLLEGVQMLLSMKCLGICPG